MMIEQIQEIPQPIQPVQQVPVELKRKFNLKIIVISLVVISLIATGVYAGIARRNKQSKPISIDYGRMVKKITLAPTKAVPVYDPITGWKIYERKYVYHSGSKIDFQISYPTDWFIKDDYLTSFDLEEARNSGFPKTLVDCYFKGEEDLRSVPLDNFGSKILDEKVVRNDSVKITKMLIKRVSPNIGGEGMMPLKYEYYLFEALSYGHVVLQCSRVDDSFKAVFDQILSTFRFLD